MTSKGKQYSTIVRRAGLAWGKVAAPPATAWAEGAQLNGRPSLRRHSRAEGDIRKASNVLEAGIALATQNGDAEVVQVFQHDLERYQRAAAGEALDLSR
jgi:DNA polymerase III delta prime subunit